MTAAVAACVSAALLRQSADHPSRVQTWGRTLAPRPGGEGPYPSTCQTPSSIRVRVILVLPLIDRSNVLTTSAGSFSVPPPTLFRQWQRESQKDIPSCVALDRSDRETYPPGGHASRDRRPRSRDMRWSSRDGIDQGDAGPDPHRGECPGPGPSATDRRHLGAPAPVPIRRPIGLRRATGLALVRRQSGAHRCRRPDPGRQHGHRLRPPPVRRGARRGAARDRPDARRAAVRRRGVRRRAGPARGRPADDLVALYCREGEQIRAHGGTPILFQCSALTALPDREIVGVYRAVAERVGPILGFELGQMFAPFGKIYSLELFAELLQIPGLVGLKHSSLDRVLEWQRLALRDRVRPDFKLYTGNDLAIDMVIYGSDYLLGLSTFAPGSVRPARPALGGRRPALLHAERRAPVPRRVRLPGACAQPTSTAPPSSSTCGAGRRASQPSALAGPARVGPGDPPGDLPPPGRHRRRDPAVRKPSPPRAQARPLPVRSEEGQIQG